MGPHLLRFRCLDLHQRGHAFAVRRKIAGGGKPEAHQPFAGLYSCLIRERHLGSSSVNSPGQLPAGGRFGMVDGMPTFADSIDRAANSRIARVTAKRLTKGALR